MAFDWEEFRDEISADVIQELGSEVTLQKADGRKAKAKAIETQPRKYDSTQNPSRLTLNQKQFLIDGKISKIPEVGDFIIKDKETFHITEVAGPRPGLTKIHYRVSVV